MLQSPVKLTEDGKLTWLNQWKNVSLREGKYKSRIIDARAILKEEGAQSHIIHGLSQAPRSLPTWLLYDDTGLELYEKITQLDEYYLTKCERDILTTHCLDIMGRVGSQTIIVELGAGSMVKSRILLNALEAMGKQVYYFALDLIAENLELNLNQMPNYKHVTVCGLCGTYEDGMEFLYNCPTETPRMVWWLGSSVGNYKRAEAAEFLLHLHDRCIRPMDMALIGIDGRNKPEKVKLAYNDPKGVTSAFILNGLSHVNSLFPIPPFTLENFEYHGVYNEEKGRHEAHCKSKLAQVLTLDSKDGRSYSVELSKDEMIHMEYSYKYSHDETMQLFGSSGFSPIQRWTNKDGKYFLHLVGKAPTSSRNLLRPPSLEDWKELWKLWDKITLSILPEKLILERPIDLRHPFIFYIGHIPTFCDIQITNAIGNHALFTEPIEFTKIFERGIDPDMDEPNKCHDHSDVPDSNSWPNLDSILSYRDRVRRRVIDLTVQKIQCTRQLCHALWMAFEHEVMHAETILYMLVQLPSSSCIPPTIFRPLVGEPETVPIKYIQIPSQSLEIGYNGEDFVWDNEKPCREIWVNSYSIQSRPITIGEYYEFLERLVPEGHPFDLIPGSWGATETTSGYSLKTLFGLIPIEHVLTHPVFVNYNQAAAFARHMSVRLPTEEELRLFYNSLSLSDGKFREQEARRVGAGFHGFKSWGTSPLNEVEGVGNGWEWTSTIFQRHEGFQPSPQYPGYSADFFDGKHHVLLGGSWATHPRIAERPTFRNWYQRGYPYVFSTFRCVRD